MSSTTKVFKSGGRVAEPFDPNKLKKTIYAACLNVREPEASAESTVDMVVQEMERWLAEKPEVTSLDIKEKAVEILKRVHPEAAYIYDQYNLTI